LVLNNIEKYGSKLNAIFKVCKNEFPQQVWGLGILPYRYFAVLKISRKSLADSCSTYFPGEKARLGFCYLRCLLVLRWNVLFRSTWRS